MLRKRLIFILMLLVSTLIVPNVLRAQDQDIVPRWSAPEYIGYGWFPSIATDKTGMAHIIWSQQRSNENGDDLLYYSNRRGPGIGPEEGVDVIYNGGGGYTIRNGMDITSDGIIRVAYRAKTAHFTAAAPLDRALSANEWVTSEQISNGYYIDLTVDRSDNVHLVSSSHGTNLQMLGLEGADPLAIQERFPCAFCSDLLYYRSTDNGETWSTATNISETIGGSERMHIFEGHSGRLYVGWSDGSDWYIGKGDYQDVRLVYSDDQGESWSEPIILAGNRPDAHPTQGAFTEMLDGSIFAVWRYDTNFDANIYYQISDDDGITWTEPEAVPGILADTVSASILDHYAVTTDLSGAVHLFAAGFEPVTQQGPALYHLEYRQGRWLLPNRIYYDPDTERPEWPQVAVGPQNDLHVVWFVRVGDRKFEGDVGSTYIYYAYRTPTLPNNPLEVAYAPTPTPLPRVAAVPDFLPTVTAVPTFEVLDPNVNTFTNRDQYASQTLLGAVVAVILFCGIVLVVLGFRPRTF